MKIRIATIDDYNELVEMYKNLLEIIYTDMQIGKDIFIHGAVQNWFRSNYDIIICEKDDGTTTGFSVAYVQDVGIIEPYYMGELAYVKPEFRNGRTAYLLYTNVLKYADNQGLPVVAKAFVGNGGRDKVEQIQAKFGECRFVEYHRNKKAKRIGHGQ